MNIQQIQSILTEIKDKAKESGNPKTIKAAAIAEVIINSAAAVVRIVKSDYPPKRAFKLKIDRRPIKRILKAQLKSNMMLANYMNVMQIRRIIEQPTPTFQKGGY